MHKVRLLERPVGQMLASQVLIGGHKTYLVS